MKFNLLKYSNEPFTFPIIKCTDIEVYVLLCCHFTKSIQFTKKTHISGVIPTQ